MFQIVSTLAVLIVLANGDSPARRDGYTLMTKRPTSYLSRMARSDRYTSRPTSYAKAMKSDGFYGLFRRYTKRPTLYKAAAKSDRYTSRPTPPYAAAKSDGFLRYFRRYFTKRPTAYAARRDFRTMRPTTRRYGVRGDLKTQRPTSRRYNLGARSDLITRKPTRQRYADKFVKVEVDEDEKTGQVGKGATNAQQMVPEAEVLDKKYFYVKTRLGWNNAQEACARRGAQLATIHSKNEHDRVAKACQGDCWLGADRSEVGGSFKWNDDSAMDFEKWDQARQKSGLCAKMTESTQKSWVAADCDEKLGFVCQKMQWNGRLQASVESDSFWFARTFARGNILSLAMMIVVVIVVGFLACNYVCMIAKDKKSLGKQEEDRTKNGTRDETTPLLWTRA